MDVQNMKWLSPNTLQAVSFALFLASLPLISFGTMEEQQPIWWLGLAMVIVAGLLPTLAHFAADDDDEEEGADAETEADGGDEGADDDGRADQDDLGPPSAGPIGRGAGSAGREPQRARVEEQEDHAREAASAKKEESQ